MGDQPARKFYAEMRRRNEFDEWGLELAGGWGEGEDSTWMEVIYVRYSEGRTVSGLRSYM